MLERYPPEHPKENRLKMKTHQKTQTISTDMPIEKLLMLSENIHSELANLEDSDSSSTSVKFRELLDELLGAIYIHPDGVEIMLPQADGNYYPFQPVKPVSLATLLTLIKAARKAQVIQ